MSSQKTVTVTPPNFPLHGKVAPPGSKSITNRALLLAALAKGTSRLSGALKATIPGTCPWPCARWA